MACSTTELWVGEETAHSIRQRITHTPESQRCGIAHVRQQCRSKAPAATRPTPARVRRFTTNPPSQSIPFHLARLDMTRHARTSEKTKPSPREKPGRATTTAVVVVVPVGITTQTEAAPTSAFDHTRTTASPTWTSTPTRLGQQGGAAAAGAQRAGTTATGFGGSTT